MTAQCSAFVHYIQRSTLQYQFFLVFGCWFARELWNN